MQLTFSSLLVAATFVFSSGRAAVAEPYDFPGVWQGTIGSAHIMACLVPATQLSSYYYLQHRTSIPLTHVTGEANEWQEGSASGPRATWQLTSSKNGQLIGKWISNNSSHQELPIKLSRLASVTSQVGDECGDEKSASFKAYNKPRVDSTVTHIKEFSDKAMLSTSDGGIAIILPPNTNDISSVARQAHSWLDAKIADFYSCKFDFASNPSNSPDSFRYQYKLYVSLRSPHWLVATQLGYKYCSDANTVQSDQEVFVWNLDASIQVNPWTWIANSEDGCPETCRRKPSKALQDLIVSMTHPNDENRECARLVHNNDTYLIRPTSRGLVFSGIVYQSRDCDFDTEVPYDALQKFLTPNGKEVTKSFLTDRAPDLRTFGL